MKQPKDKIFHLKEAEINAALNQEYRQYFIGDLKKPQILNYIEQGDFEIGTSLYQTAKADVPHMHDQTSEILYILQGTYKILIIETMQEYTLNKGDFFVLPPRTAYASKALAQTQVLFIKTGGNDKVAVPIPSEVQQWMKSY